MGYNLNLNQNNVQKIAVISVITVIFLGSCSPAKYVPEGSYLLNRNKLETSRKSVSEDKLKSYIIQEPNKKILGVRFHLFLYNLSNIKKNRWPHNWLRRIGEEPVIYNQSTTSASSEQLRQFLENKGYYQAVVRDTVTFKRKNAKVTYRIDPQKPTRVNRITYYFEDTSLISQVLPDTLNSLLRRGMIFDKDVLQNERIRIEALLKEKGYFRFAKEYIYYTVTMNEEAYTADTEMGFKEFVEGRPDPRTKVKIHPKYLINNVYVFPDYGSLGSLVSQPSELEFDTTRYQYLYFLTYGKKTLKMNAVANLNYITPGRYYKQSDVNKTYRNISELGPIRYINITFKENDTITGLYPDRILDSRIELTRKKVQSYQTELAGTNSGGDLGVRGNLSYQNLNLLRGAEVLNMRFTGAIEALNNRSTDDNKISSMKEIGVESSIMFPKFFSPFRLSGFVRKYSPKTTISSSFNYQSRPDYTRSVVNGSFSYKWNGSQYVTHTIWPVEINYINIYETISSSRFLDSIRKTPLGFSFEDHVVNVFRYGFELNNQNISGSRDFVFLRFNIESAGNLVHFANTNLSQSNELNQYQLFNVPYFQYLRSDIDFRYYNNIDQQNKLAYRFYVGLGKPYGNSASLPFEKKFFAGGPNSIRAWSSRDLGPGADTTRSINEVFDFPNKSGDIKLEANVEYRFKVIWKMEAAIFLDAGNIWAIRPESDKPGAEFEWNRFYKEIAIGTGIGARFDFSFFLIRVDMGLKLRDPAEMVNARWVSPFRDRPHFNFGIGYPF